MKYYVLITLVLLAVIVATACGAREPTSAELERQQLELERTREKLEAQRAKHALWLQFWQKVQPWLAAITVVAAVVVAALIVWFLYETIDVYSIRHRQTQVEAGKELVYTPRRNAVLMVQRMLHPFAVLTRGKEHAPAMAADEKMQMTVSLAQLAVQAKAVEAPVVAFQSPGNPTRLPAGTQPLHVVEPEKLTPWVEDVRGQLAAGDVVDAEEVETG